MSSTPMWTASSPRIAAKLSKRVGYELRAPQLETMGLKLVGGRLLPGAGGAAAFFMYEGDSGERITIYCTKSKLPETSLRYRIEGPVGAFYWFGGDMVYVV